MGLFDNPKKSKNYKIKSSQLGDNFIQQTALKINDALRKIGAGFYQVCSRLHEKGNKQFFKLTWRKLGNQCFVGEDRNKYPNASYTSEKRVKEVLSRDFGISLSEIENNPEKAIEKALAKKEATENARIEKEKSRAEKRESRTQKKAEKQKAKSERAAAKAEKKANKPAKKEKPAKVKKEKVVKEVKKIEKEVEKIQETAKEIKQEPEKVEEKSSKFEAAGKKIEEVSNMLLEMLKRNSGA